MEHDWNTCQEDACEECTFLAESGIVMACDDCAKPGHTDSPGGWTRDEDGMCYCDDCAVKRGLKK